MWKDSKYVHIFERLKSSTLSSHNNELCTPDIIYSLAQTRQRDIYGTWTTAGIPARNEQADHHTQDYKKYQLLLGCPGTGKTQVVKRLVHTLIEEEYSVSLRSPGSSSHQLSGGILPWPRGWHHPRFNIPVAADQQYVVNYAIGKSDAIIVDEASKVADDTFHMIHDMLEKQVHRPLVIIAGDKCQQPPLQTVNGRTIQTTSILKNRHLHEVCQIQSLYQFRCTDKAYLDFLQYIRYSKPEQYVLITSSAHCSCSISQMWRTTTYGKPSKRPDATFLTMSRAAATRVNSIVIRRMFQEKTPLSSIPLENDVEEFLPFKHMRVILTLNLHKSTSVVNSQLANIVNNEKQTLLLQFPARPRSLIQ